jgi:hypothetical protein
MNSEKQKGLNTPRLFICLLLGGAGLLEGC